MSILMIIISAYLSFSEIDKPEQLHIQGLRPGDHLVSLLPYALTGRIEETETGWEFARIDWTVGIHRNEPLRISSVKSFGASGLSQASNTIVQANGDISGLDQTLLSLGWSPLKGESNRLYWKSGDTYLRVRLIPKSARVHEVALFDENGLSALVMRKPAFLSEN